MMALVVNGKLLLRGAWDFVITWDWLIIRLIELSSFYKYGVIEMSA